MEWINWIDFFHNPLHFHSMCSRYTDNRSNPSNQTNCYILDGPEVGQKAQFLNVLERLAPLVVVKAPHTDLFLPPIVIKSTKHGRRWANLIHQPNGKERLRFRAYRKIHPVEIRERLEHLIHLVAVCL